MLKRTFWTKRTTIIASSVVALIAVVALALVVVMPGLAHAQTYPTENHLTPRFDAVGITPHNAKNAKYAHELLTDPARFNSIPFWSSSFSNGGTTYPYSMVGYNPAYGITSTVQTEIIPVRVVFNNVVFDGLTKVGATANSPLFLNSTYPDGVGRTQYGDAIQRANWWQYASHNNYHVLLSYPAIESTLVVNVPSYHGAIFNTPGGQVVVVDINWWFNVILDNLYGRHTSPNVFPIFLTNNVLLSVGDPNNPNNCCIIGYHDAEFQPGSTTNIDTFAWGSYVSHGVFSVPIQDVNALSHEVAEWLNDPFGTNVVPVWSVPSEPQYGCSNVLEVGDPLVGVTFTASTSYGTYTMQDEVFFPWFARQSPSLSFGGRYTFLGTFSTYSSSAGC